MRTNEKVIKEISVGNENIPISAKYIGNYEIGDIKDMIDDSKYTLPTATDTTLGGVKIGSNITVSSGTISLTKSNVTTALGYTPPTTNTTYGVANLESNGLMSATTFASMAYDSAISSLSNISFETDPHDSGVRVYATQGVAFTNYAKGESKYSDGEVVGTIDIPAATTTKAGVMSAADKSYLNFLSTYVINSSSRVLTSASIYGDDSSVTLSFNTVNRDVDGSVITEAIEVELPMASYDSVNGDSRAGLMSAADKQTLEELKQQMSNINLILEYIINS